MALTAVKAAAISPLLQAPCSNVPAQNVNNSKRTVACHATTDDPLRNFEVLFPGADEMHCSVVNHQHPDTTEAGLLRPYASLILGVFSSGTDAILPVGPDEPDETADQHDQNHGIELVQILS
jgi:hypothetical protein